MTDPATITLHVNGMTCQHCVQAVTSELTALDGVEDVSVDLIPDGTSSVTVRSRRALSTEELRTAIDGAGYALAES
ncbi:MAG TPA: heavy-metal-associated domain-containing protein [Kineosporiaceae bacterium]